MRARTLRWLEIPPSTVAAVLVCTALLGWVQFSFDGLRDSDSYFHTRAARELAVHGVRDTFPQTAFSTWSVRYSDKDLLFHVLLVPLQWVFGSDDLVRAGKWAVVALDLAVFAALAGALHALGARQVWFWIALYFTMDVDLLTALLAARPGVLAIALVVLEIALIARGRAVALGIVGALHTWSHSSFVLLPLVACAAWFAALSRGERKAWPLPVAACAGPLVATLANPYFPNNLHMTWDQLVNVAIAVWWGSSEIPAQLFGPELMPTRTSLFLGSWPGFLPAVLGIVAMLGARERRLSPPGLTLVAVAGALLIPGFLSERFLDYFFPAVILLGARLWSELAGTAPLRDLVRGNRRALVAVALLLACPLAGLGGGGMPALLAHVRSATTGEAQRPAIEFLRNAARPDELVYHHFWWDFSILYHYRPNGRYVEALDPVFFYRHDPRRFRESLAIYEGRTADVFGALRDDFGARWVYLPKAPQYHPFFERMRADPRFQKAYEDEHVLIARLP